MGSRLARMNRGRVFVHVSRAATKPVTITGKMNKNPSPVHPPPARKTKQAHFWTCCSFLAERRGFVVLAALALQPLGTACLAHNSPLGCYALAGSNPRFPPARKTKQAPPSQVAHGETARVRLADARGPLWAQRPYFGTGQALARALGAARRARSVRSAHTTKPRSSGRGCYFLAERR